MASTEKGNELLLRLRGQDLNPGPLGYELVEGFSIEKRTDRGNNSAGGVAIPQLGDTAWFGIAFERASDIGDYLGSVGQAVCALGDGNRAFRILAKCKTGYPEVSGFFLDATRVRNGKSSIEQKVHEAAIGERIR